MKEFAHNTIVVGSGAAALSAAEQLNALGVDAAIVTEGMNKGTSRNTGSDKQTYYKLTLSGNVPDSPADMAADLFAGQCVDGDVALCEAALSTRAFLRLCELGVPFPVNRYGEFVGYKTDHDPRARATSAGPLTSRLMTEALERAVKARGVPVYDGYLAVRILKDEHGAAAGVLALGPDGAFARFAARNVVWATGGPAGIYENTVYPAGHFAMSGAPLMAGALGRNLTEWQYGLASVYPRWNVSGTYMQVLPRFFSVDEAGQEYDFLQEAFESPADCLLRVFLKGYEWPFDCRKTERSSAIDLLVHREVHEKKRRVFLDYRANPYGGELDFSILPPEAREYLENAGALFGKPIDRLLHMNAPAYELYLSKGVDLKREPLEIALCAQHNNGGIDVDLWWRTRAEGLYVAGEAACTHGVYRPGGSALNAGQVGSLRAAQHIARKGQGELRASDESVEKESFALAEAVLGGEDNAQSLIRQFESRMSACAAALREEKGIRALLNDVNLALENFADRVRVKEAVGLKAAFRLRDMLFAQRAYLFAMLDYLEHGGGSRGSALYIGHEAGAPLGGVTQLIDCAGDVPKSVWREVHPLPEAGGFFENVWREYREDGGVR